MGDYERRVHNRLAAHPGKVRADAAAIAAEADAEIHALRTAYAALITDAYRYRWLRTAGAWESETGMELLSDDHAKFDAAVDAAMAA